MTRRKARVLVSEIFLTVAGAFALFCSFFSARAGDVGGAIVFAVPAQVLWTTACVSGLIRRTETKDAD